MNAKADHCPSSQILAKFGIGNLDPARAETISQHLETCVECRGVVEKVPPDSFIGLVLEAHGYSASAVSSATVPPASAAVSFGDLIPPASLLDRGDYEIIRPLGRGGMGVVYLARNRVLDRLEVLKAVSKSLLDRPGVIERFQREIRAAARLHHPNVVAVYTRTAFRRAVDPGHGIRGWREPGTGRPGAGTVCPLSMRPATRIKRRWDCSTRMIGAWCIATLSRAT